MKRILGLVLVLTLSLSACSGEPPEQAAREEPPEQTAQEEAPEQTAQEEAPEQIAQEEAPEQAAREEAPEQVAREEAPEQAAREEAPEQTAQEEVPEQTAQEEPPEQTAREEAPEQTAQKEAPEQTAWEEAPGRTAQEEPPEQTAQEEPPEQTAQGEVPEQTAQEEAPEQTAREEAPVPAVPEVEFITVDGFQCPQIKTKDKDDKIVRVVNEEIERQFREVLPRYDDGSVWDTVSKVYTFVSTTDSMISILFKPDKAPRYRTDNEIRGICYDYKNKMIVPSYLACLSEMGYPYIGVTANLWRALDEKAWFKCISVDYVYFDTNSEPVFVVRALEHEWEPTEGWLRYLYYSPVEDTLVDGPWSECPD